MANCRSSWYWIGITQNSSDLEDICDFLSKTKYLKLDETVFSPKKWDITNDLYDFKTGKNSSLNSISKLFMADTKSNKVIIYKNKEEI